MPGRIKKRALSKAELDAAVKRIDEQLEHARANKAKLEERVQEYDELQGALESLPEKVAHPIMVPYGPLAFFEGYIEHTNEVLTQLSSEWFALRTTKSALEMVGRRRARLQGDQEDVSREERDLLMRRRVAVEAGASGGRPPAAHVAAPPEAPQGAEVRYDEEGFLDIREPYAEDDDDDDTAGSAPASSGYPAMPSAPKVLGPAAAATVADVAASATGSKAEPGASAKGASAPEPPEGDGGVFARLKELERLEELEELEELDRLEELEEEEGDAGKAQDREDGGQQQRAQAAVVKSPADLFKMMSQVEEASSEAGADLPAGRGAAGPKGDRKASTQSSSARAPDDAAQPKAADAGFARDILERVGSASISAAPAAASSMQTGPPLGASASADSASAADAGNAAPKRVSKFKAERQRARG